MLEYEAVLSEKFSIFFLVKLFLFLVCSTYWRPDDYVQMAKNNVPSPQFINGTTYVHPLYNGFPCLQRNHVSNSQKKIILPWKIRIFHDTSLSSHRTDG